MPQLVHQRGQSELEDGNRTGLRVRIPQGPKWKRYPEDHTECSGRYFSGSTVTSDTEAAVTQAAAYCAAPVEDRHTYYFVAGEVEVYLCNYGDWGGCTNVSETVVQDSIDKIQAQCGTNQGGWQSYATAYDGNNRSWVYGLDPTGAYNC